MGLEGFRILGLERGPCSIGVCSSLIVELAHAEEISVPERNAPNTFCRDGSPTSCTSLTVQGGLRLRV